MEDWRSIPQSPHYLVSDHQRIKSLARIIIRKNGQLVNRIERILKPHHSKVGYLTVAINKRTTPIHVLICSAFHGPKPFPHAEVEHLDDDKFNNHPDNLKWSTRIENVHSAYRNNKVPLGSKTSWSKITEEDVVKIRQDNRIHKNIAQQYGISRSTVSEIKKRLIWKHVL